MPETRTAPTVTVGGYGFLAPHHLHGGVVYLVASKQLTPRAYPQGVFAHLGLEVQTFANAELAHRCAAVCGGELCLEPPPSILRGVPAANVMGA